MKVCIKVLLDKTKKIERKFRKKNWRFVLKFSEREPELEERVRTKISKEIDRKIEPELNEIVRTKVSKEIDGMIALKFS